MRAFRHQDHAAENAAGFIVKHIGVKQVAGGSAVKVLLAGSLVQLLVFLQMVGGKQADSCAVSVQDAERFLSGPGCAGIIRHNMGKLHGTGTAVKFLNQRVFDR